jgi:pimeloyl-ACP methyl ester carboxylesterase
MCRIAHILEATSAETISYVGHSQGTTMALAAMSKSLPATKVISGAVLLAPVAFVSAARSQTLSTLAALDVPAVIRRFGVRSFLPCTAGSSLVFSQICVHLPSFCISFLQDLVGKSESLNSSRIPLYLNYLPAGTLSFQKLLLYLTIPYCIPKMSTAVCIDHFAC